MTPWPRRKNPAARARGLDDDAVAREAMEMVGHHRLVELQTYVR